MGKREKAAGDVSIVIEHNLGVSRSSLEFQLAKTSTMYEDFAIACEFTSRVV
jgi:hypothetical protein